MPWFVALDCARDESAGKPYLATPERVLNSQRRVIKEGLAIQGPNLMYLHDSDLFSTPANGGEFEGQGLSLHAEEWFKVLNQYQPWRG